MIRPQHYVDWRCPNREDGSNSKTTIKHGSQREQPTRIFNKITHSISRSIEAVNLANGQTTWLDCMFGSNWNAFLSRLQLLLPICLSHLVNDPVNQAISSSALTANLTTSAGLYHSRRSLATWRGFIGILGWTIQAYNLAIHSIMWYALVTNVMWCDARKHG